MRAIPLRELHGGHGRRHHEQRLVSDCTESFVGELELDVLELEELLVLLDEGVLWFGQYPNKIFPIEISDRPKHRQTADELGDETEVDEVLRANAGEHVAEVVSLLAARQ